MTTEEFIRIMDSGAEVIAKSEVHLHMTHLSNEAMKITSELNNSYHTPEEIGELMTRLTGRKFPEGAYMFPPFYTDCGKNIKLGKNVYKRRLSVSGSGRNYYRRRQLNRPQDRNRHAQPPSKTQETR